MEKLKFIVIAACFFTLPFGCKRDSTLSDRNPIEVSLKIVTVSRDPTDVVSSGGNFIFSLELFNASEQRWLVSHGSIVTSGFTKLYRKLSNGADSLVGSAHNLATCSFQSGVVIEPKQRLRYDIPWVADPSLTATPSCNIQPEANSPLPVGRYFTKMDGFIEALKGEEAVRIPMTGHNVDFEVK